MKLSARNQLKGTVVSVVRGPVNALVKLDLGGGHHVTATLTAEAVDDLGITEGTEATAVFKASSVVLGIE